MCLKLRLWINVWKLRDGVENLSKAAANKIKGFNTTSVLRHRDIVIRGSNSVFSNK